MGFFYVSLTKRCTQKQAILKDKIIDLDEIKGYNTILVVGKGIYESEDQYNEVS